MKISLNEAWKNRRHQQNRKIPDLKMCLRRVPWRTPNERWRKVCLRLTQQIDTHLRIPFLGFRPHAQTMMNSFRTTRSMESTRRKKGVWTSSSHKRKRSSFVDHGATLQPSRSCVGQLVTIMFFDVLRLCGSQRLILHLLPLIILLDLRR